MNSLELSLTFCLSTPNFNDPFLKTCTQIGFTYAEGSSGPQARPVDLAPGVALLGHPPCATQPLLCALSWASPDVSHGLGVQHLFEHLCISGGFGLFGYLRSFYLGMYHYLHNAAPRPPLPPYPNVPLAQLISYKMSPVNIWKMSQSVQYLSLYLSAIR